MTILKGDLVVSRKYHPPRIYGEFARIASEKKLDRSGPMLVIRPFRTVAYVLCTDGSVKTVKKHDMVTINRLEEGSLKVC